MKHETPKKTVRLLFKLGSDNPKTNLSLQFAPSTRFSLFRSIEAFMTLFFSSTTLTHYAPRPILFLSINASAKPPLDLCI